MKPKFSICIPRIDDSVQKYNIFHSFRKLFIGRIDRIDIVKNHKTNSRRAFVHYSYLYDNKQSTDIISHLNIGKHINIVYNFPTYWKCYKSNIPYTKSD